MTSYSPLPEIQITDECNYIAAFLTMACPFRCSYCINEFESGRKRFQTMPVENWIQGLSRLANLNRPEGIVPITFQGGEPSAYPGFYDLINRLPERIRIDILTNLCFDVEEMITRVNPERLTREAPYASIRVSYHPDQVELEELLAKTHRLLKAGFSVGIWGLLHPEQAEKVLTAQQRAKNEGIDFRTKEFLGFYQDKLYGQYKFPQACSLETTRNVLCMTSELLIAPDGGIYRCHHDLYEQCEPIGRVLDGDFQMTGQYQPCDCYGFCNPCDVKVKTNRLQQFGHTSVSILFPEHSHPAVDESAETTSLK